MPAQNSTTCGDLSAAIDHELIEERSRSWNISKKGRLELNDKVGHRKKELSNTATLVAKALEASTTVIKEIQAENMITSKANQNSIYVENHLVDNLFKIRKNRL